MEESSATQCISIAALMSVHQMCRNYTVKELCTPKTQRFIIPGGVKRKTTNILLIGLSLGQEILTQLSIQYSVD